MFISSCILICQCVFNKHKFVSRSSTFFDRNQVPITTRRFVDIHLNKKNLIIEVKLLVIRPVILYACGNWPTVKGDEEKNSDSSKKNSKKNVRFKKKK